ncbi:MAG TPA: alanyl-tRNA editing protein, partial [Rhodobacteraceae bacterium]|nr:alanyl-tRNA editing protein [Paracoccaceae bacterium]
MTAMMFRSDPYLREAAAMVQGHTDEGGIVLDQSIFYPTGGGQPGDSGLLLWEDHSISIATTIKGQGDDIVLLPAEPLPMPPVGA